MLLELIISECMAVMLMCPEHALTPSSNNAYYADTSTELIILFNTQDEARMRHKKVLTTIP